MPMHSVTAVFHISVVHGGVPKTNWPAPQAWFLGNHVTLSTIAMVTGSASSLSYLRKRVRIFSLCELVSLSKARLDSCKYQDSMFLSSSFIGKPYKSSVFQPPGADMFVRGNMLKTSAILWIIMYLIYRHVQRTWTFMAMFSLQHFHSVIKKCKIIHIFC